MTGRRGQLLAEVEEMIARLRKLKDHERDTRLRGVYLASIERLEGLSYRLRKPETHVIGLPARQAAPPPAPERLTERWISRSGSQVGGRTAFPPLRHRLGG